MRKTNIIQASYSKPYALFGSRKPKFLRKFKHYHKHIFFGRIIAKLLLLKNGNYYQYKGKKGGQMMKIHQKTYGNKWNGPKNFHWWCQFAHINPKPFRVTSSDENIHWYHRKTTSPPLTMPICKNFIIFVIEFFCTIIARGLPTRSLAYFLFLVGLTLQQCHVIRELWNHVCIHQH